MSDEMVKAPWTAVQVARANRLQRNPGVHPYTCALCRDALGVRDGDAYDDRILVATLSGWICPTCDYTQDWAHSFTVGPAHITSFAPLTRVNEINHPEEES